MSRVMLACTVFAIYTYYIFNAHLELQAAPYVFTNYAHLCELCTLIAYLVSSVQSVHNSLKVCFEHTKRTLCVHLLKTVHTFAGHMQLVTIILKCAHSSHIWQGNAEQCISLYLTAKDQRGN